MEQQKSIEKALDNLMKAIGSNPHNPQVEQYREDEIARLSEELHRRRGTENIDMVLEKEERGCFTTKYGP